nr:sigma-70 family RNA polymerase sigma factor [Microvirga antarctica]
MHLGELLQEIYAETTAQRLPPDLRRLLKRTFLAIRAFQEPTEPAFLQGIISFLPELRKFAFSLSRNYDFADDLVQETILKALSKREAFEEGTNLRSWLVTILKNTFFSGIRRNGREVADPDGLHASKMATAPEQHDKLIHQELASALAALPADFRDVLTMVTIEGLSYEEAAARMGCAIGTIKSRVSRARRQLAEQMRLSEADLVGWTRV